ncbi:carboxymuconolactone decarboxylase family protein [Cryobacterium tagatosivorans]|uniref:carboxymuconolactone decarboxylase family protein n=1 Tax=Cryobacterium tagatosivorans TaxID=1259199 RepID=UPI00141A693A|nr:carboxymuconolactone decarboxylase family protein [Cryobacterium tagatosivorans]
MSRLPLLGDGQLEPDQEIVFRSIAGGKRAAFFRSIGMTSLNEGLPGPFNAMVIAPTVGMPLHRLGEALRYEGVLPPLVREVVILTVAAVRDSQFEWASHEPEARKQGADAAMLDVIRDGSESLADDQCAAAVAFARTVLSGAHVDDVLFDRLQEMFGDSGVVELVVLLGYYVLLAELMSVFSIE